MSSAILWRSLHIFLLFLLFLFLGVSTSAIPSINARREESTYKNAKVPSIQKRNILVRITEERKSKFFSFKMLRINVVQTV